MRSIARGKLLAELAPSTRRLLCNCGWLRPHFVDVRVEKDGPSIDLPSFYLLFDCPVCGARWDAHYEKVQ